MQCSAVWHADSPHLETATLLGELFQLLLDRVTSHLEVESLAVEQRLQDLCLKVHIVNLAQKLHQITRRLALQLLHAYPVSPRHV